jgi:hypothetical protein
MIVDGKKEEEIVLGKIDCIKLLRAINPDAGLVDAKSMVEEFYRLFNIELISSKSEYSKFVSLCIALRTKALVFQYGDFVKITRKVLDPLNFTEMI